MGRDLENGAMNRDIERYRMVSRRTLVLGGLKLSLMAMLVGRMYHLQVVEAEKYRGLAEDNRVNFRLIAPTRGHIIDRNGVPLAVNKRNYRVLVVAERAENVEETLHRLSRFVPLSETEIGRILREIRRRRPFVPVTVREHLTWRQVAEVEVNTPDLPGVSIDVGDIRHYPYQAAAAHILGYVGAVSKDELTGDPVLALPGFQIGKSGIEKQHEAYLRGHAGMAHQEVNAVGRVIRELSRDEGQPGREVMLTIDIVLQEFAQRRLADEKSASAVIIDVHSGALYAMASSPSFDPNLFATGIDVEDWRRLSRDPTTPLINKAIAGQYSPGSTFKMMVALAALEVGVVTPRYRSFCNGKMKLGNHDFHCWKRGGHGHLDMIGAIQQSCDVYFYDLARRVGVDRIAEMCGRFGLGHRLDVDLPGEREGLIPTRAWKRARFGRPWQPGESLVAAIGQGYVLTTPLQLAAMTARLVNHGRAVRPHLTRAIRGVGPVPEDAPSIGVSQRNLDVMVEAMAQVTMSLRGTAFRARIREPGYEMGGKTGTAQVKRITQAERSAGIVKNEDKPWRYRDHALFVGFAPVHAPQYAISVVVEHGGGGSSVAAPIAHDLLLECQKRAPAKGPPASGVPVDVTAIMMDG